MCIQVLDKETYGRHFKSKNLHSFSELKLREGWVGEDINVLFSCKDKTSSQLVSSLSCALNDGYWLRQEKREPSKNIRG